MANGVAKLCADLGVVLVPCNQRGGSYRTKAGNIIARMLERHGEGHTILVLRTVVESEGNDAMLTEPVIHGISDVLLAHPSWGDRGLAWPEAFDEIDLKAMAAAAKANRKASAARAAIATMLHAKLSLLFEPPPKVRPPRKPYVYKRGPRSATIAKQAQAA